VVEKDAATDGAVELARERVLLATGCASPSAPEKDAALDGTGESARGTTPVDEARVEALVDGPIVLSAAVDEARVEALVDGPSVETPSSDGSGVGGIVDATVVLGAAAVDGARVEALVDGARVEVLSTAMDVMFGAKTSGSLASESLASDAGSDACTDAGTEYLTRMGELRFGAFMSAVFSLYKFGRAWPRYRIAAASTLSPSGGMSSSAEASMSSSAEASV